MAHMGPSPYQFDKWNCQMFINIKKYLKNSVNKKSSFRNNNSLSNGYIRPLF